MSIKIKQNWQTKKLGEILKLEYGKPLQRSERASSGLYPVYGANGIKDYSDKFYLNYPSIIVGRKGSAGEINLTAEKFWPLDVTYYVTYDNKKYDLKFLYNLLKFLELPKLAKGVKPGINRNDVYAIEVKIPPLPEQVRIVDKLDDFFRNIVRTKENTEKNLQNSKEFFDNYLHKIFTNNSSGWNFKKLSAVAEYFNGLTYSPKDVSDKGIIVLRSSNIQNDELDFLDIVRVNRIVKDKIIVQDGDILMCSRNGSKRLVGKTATISSLKEKMTFGTFMMIVRSNQNSYLKWFFKTNEFRRQITSGGNTMINQITRYMLDDVIISFPPPQKQKSIVAKLDVLSAQMKKLQENYEKKLEDLEELKKSILKQAFSGAL